MIGKDKLLEMIDHCLYYTGESYAVVFYEKYKDMIQNSLLKEEERAASQKVLDDLIQASLRHLAILRRLKEDVEGDEKDIY